jgi:hypothetical protein
MQMVLVEVTKAPQDFPSFVYDLAKHGPNQALMTKEDKGKSL